MKPDFPCPEWIDLRTPDGKLVARFDPRRGLLEYQERWRKIVFDLAQIVREHSPTIPDHKPKT